MTEDEIVFAIVCRDGFTYMQPSLEQAREALKQVPAMRALYTDLPDDAHFDAVIADRVRSFLSDFVGLSISERDAYEPSLLAMDIGKSAYWLLSRQMPATAFLEVRFVVIGEVPGGHLQIGFADKDSYDRCLWRIEAGETLASITGCALN